jgi:hypothetical protein
MDAYFVDEFLKSFEDLPDILGPCPKERDAGLRHAWRGIDDAGELAAGLTRVAAELLAEEVLAVADGMDNAYWRAGAHWPRLFRSGEGPDLGVSSSQP